MSIKFSKYHGCGNDFICVDLRIAEYDPHRVAVAVCQRGFSVGADGLVGVASSSIADFKMVIINADGSTPEMCGNGLRCFAAYLFDRGEIQDQKVTVETGAGVLSFQVVDTTKNEHQIIVDMGGVYINSSLPKSDFLFPSDLFPQPLLINDSEVLLFPVGVGNPHAVAFVNNVDDYPVEAVGSSIETHSFFPNGVNVEFIEVLSDDRLKMRVWERGVGETNACGTGACAAVVAGFHLQKIKANASVLLRGGQLLIDYDVKAQKVSKQGPAKFVFSSEITI